MSNSERVPDFLSTSFSFLVRFGGAKLHIFFSTTKYFLIFFKNIFSPLFPWNQFHAFPRNKFLIYILLHPQLLKKREAKSTQPFCIFQMFWVIFNYYFKTLENQYHCGIQNDFKIIISLLLPLLTRSYGLKKTWFKSSNHF